MRLTKRELAMVLRAFRLMTAVQKEHAFLNLWDCAVSGQVAVLRSFAEPISQLDEDGEDGSSHFMAFLGIGLDL